MKETVVPPNDSTANRVSLEMLKRVLAVAELIAKSTSSTTEEESDLQQKLLEKTQK